MRVFAIVPISSLPTFRPAVTHRQMPSCGLALFTSSIADATAMLESIIAPEAPNIIPETSRLPKFQPELSFASHNRLPRSRNPKLTSRPEKCSILPEKKARIAAVIRPPIDPSTPASDFLPIPPTSRNVSTVLIVATRIAAHTGLYPLRNMGMRTEAMNTPEAMSDMEALTPFPPPIITISARNAVARYNRKGILTYSPRPTGRRLTMLPSLEVIVR